MNNRLKNAVNLAGTVSQVIIAGSILAELYLRFRNRKKEVTDPNPDDDGDFSPSSPQSSLEA